MNMTNCLKTTLKDSITNAGLLKLNEVKIDFTGTYEAPVTLTLKNTEDLTIRAINCVVSNDGTNYSNSATIGNNQLLYVNNINEQSSIIIGDKYKVKRVEPINEEPGLVNYSSLRRLALFNTSVKEFGWPNKRPVFDRPFKFSDLYGLSSLNYLYLNNSNSSYIEGKITDMGSESLATLRTINYFGTSLNPIMSTLDLQLCPLISDLNGLGTAAFSDGDYADIANISSINRLGFTFRDGGTWQSTSLRETSKNIMYGYFEFKTSSDVDNFLINMASCQPMDYLSKFIKIKNNVTRTSASDSAVATLTANGVDVSTY